MLQLLKTGGTKKSEWWSLFTSTLQIMKCPTCVTWVYILSSSHTEDTLQVKSALVTNGSSLPFLLLPLTPPTPNKRVCTSALPSINCLAPHWVGSPTQSFSFLFPVLLSTKPYLVFSGKHPLCYNWCKDKTISMTIKPRVLEVIHSQK